MTEDNRYRYLKDTRQKLFIIIFGTDTRLGRLFDVVLLYVILTSILLVMLESVQSISSRYEELFYNLEWLFTIFFTIEFLLRLWISRARKATHDHSVQKLFALAWLDLSLNPG